MVGRTGGSKAPWTEEDDVRLARAYVFATEHPGGGDAERSNYIWVRVHQRYQQILEEEAPAAALRKAGAIQTHWAAHIRPDVALYAHFVATVEGEEHEGWTDAECMREASARFMRARKQAAEEATREFQAEQEQAAFAGVDPPPKPRLRPATFRYERCYEVLRTSARFMQSVLSKQSEFTVPKKRRRRRSTAPSDAPDSRSDAVSEDDRSNQQETLPDRNVRPRLEPSGDELPVPVTDSPVEPTDDIPAFALASPATPVATTTTDGQDLATDYLRLKMRALRDRRAEERTQHRLKLTAELRGVVATISRLAEELVRGSVTSMAVAAQTEGRPTLAEEVKQDLAFFRQERCRLRAELDAL